MINVLKIPTLFSCVGPESFSEGVQLGLRFFFLVDEEREDSNTTINGPSSARHLNGVLLAGRLWPNMECWLGIAKNPIFL